MTNVAEPVPDVAAPIRIGLIGTGGIADQWLAPALSHVPGALAWSVLSRDPVTAAAFAAKHGLKAPQPAFTDIAQFLNDPQLDAVIVASPDALHAAQALACVQAARPKHIFVEKPMTTDSASSSQLIAACQANKVRLGVGYHLRWHQGHRLLRQAIGEGKLGQIRHMDIQWTYNSPPSDWRASALMGKWWSLAAVGTHAIDLVVWLLGPTCGAVVEQCSITSSPVHGGPHDETAVVSLRFASGATAQVVSSVIFKAPRTAHIYGTAAGAVLEGTFGPYGAGKITIAGEELQFAQSNPYVGELTDFVRAIKAGSEPEADGACGLFNVQLLESAVGLEPASSVSQALISERTTMISADQSAASYRGKHFTIPTLNSQGAVFINPRRSGTRGANRIVIPQAHPIITSLNKPFDAREFLTARKPISLGVLPRRARMAFRPGVPRTLDLPIKFPGSNFRLPGEFAQLAPLIQMVANYEAEVNAACYDEYYCYLTVDQGLVKPGKLQREAPCHVDGFQGGRWLPKVRANHTYTVCDLVPTVYYVQPFALMALDENKHNFFWEMNRQVWNTNSEHAWRALPGELTLMDCYCVHRGDEAEEEVFRTFIRISFEVRIFDRKGNAHNPLFAYDWPMVPRDIESLNLVPFDQNGDPSLFVFPWQKVDGAAHDDPKARTKPVLKRA